MEKGDAKLCDELLQASAGGMQGLELSRRTRLEFDGVFRMAYSATAFVRFQCHQGSPYKF